MQNKKINRKEGLAPSLSRGFTLLELLIVIGIIAILSVILVIVLNPAETLKKARDTQRMSDLATMKTALGLYLTSTANPYLAGTNASPSNATCKSGSGAGTWDTASDLIYYSYPSDSPGGNITDLTLDDQTFTSEGAKQVAAASLNLVDGDGWLPVNLEGLSSGSPISNFPADPVNTIATLGTVAFTDLVYRYACNSTSLTFEIDAQLESDAYTSTENKRTKDGGNNSSLYEVGTNLKILGAGSTNQF